jgi:hypothetical protein
MNTAPPSPEDAKQAVDCTYEFGDVTWSVWRQVLAVATSFLGSGA